MGAGWVPCTRLGPRKGGAASYGSLEFASAEDVACQSHPEMINLRRHLGGQIGVTLPISRLLKGLNQNGLSQIVRADRKGIYDATNKFLLPQTIAPHVYEGKRRDICRVIHKASSIPRPITPVDQD